MGNIEDVIAGQKNQLLESDFREADQFKDSVSVAPTHIPTNWSEQTVLYKNGTTYRIYVYLDDTWRYVALT